MKLTVQIIVALGAIYYGFPKATNWMYMKIQNTALEQVSKPMTSLSFISNGLTSQ